MSEYIIRPASEADFPALARLWEEVFGDGPAFTDEFFRVMWAPGCCRLAEQDGALAAMGFCLTGPTARGLRCGYIYSIATFPRPLAPRAAHARRPPPQAGLPPPLRGATCPVRPRTLVSGSPHCTDRAKVLFVVLVLPN